MCRSNFIAFLSDGLFVIVERVESRGWRQACREITHWTIWQAGVDAVMPAPLVEAALRGEESIRSAPRILVVGAGKAGPGMAVGLEAAFADRLDRVEGLVNVPEGASRTLKRVRLHSARPQGVNEPTAAGVVGCGRDATPARFGRTRRCRDLLALGRRLRASSRAGRRDHACGQTGGNETPAPLRARPSTR